MSYRTLKKMLGENSLERKCRFLFGGGLLLLMIGSFRLYAWLNADLVINQNLTTARVLVKPFVMETHAKEFENQDFLPVIENMIKELNPKDVPGVSYQLIDISPTKANPANRPGDMIGYDALAKLTRGDLEYTQIDEENGVYLYYGALKTTTSCFSCHQRRKPGLKMGDLVGMIKISIPLAGTQNALNKNNASLLTMAIVTACLAMLALYAIVRYVIVKPVQHLKDVSDQIAHGNLNLRADIRTGDEFEELSHAFNRMLRHLVTVQDELREVNTDLDEKVDDLAQVNLRLYEMNKLKDEFLATMSHELRTPLNSILGFSDVLADAQNLTDRQKRFVENIQTSGKSLTVMINDVLDLAKIESGKMELQIVEFSLLSLVDQHVSALMPLAAQKNIDLTYEIDDTLPTLTQDTVKLGQILNNLLSNAVKFTPEGGRVRVRSHVYKPEHLELIVEDTGIGIPLEDQATIFEKFRQGQTIPGQRDPMKREYGGTGLGLSIVKELSKLLGGEVLLESEFGKGSTFTVRFPMRLDQQPSRLDKQLYEQTLGLGKNARVDIETAVAETQPAVE